MTRVSHSHHQIGASRRLPPRITMLASSPKYKLKEERKRVLKLCVKKLRSIEDPEAFLSRSVLINNTLKRLQSEVREEKAEKKMVTYSPSPYSFYAIEKLAYAEKMEDDLGEDQTVFEADDEAEEETSASSSSEDEDDSSSSSSASSEAEEEKKVVAEAAAAAAAIGPSSLEDELLSEVYMPPPRLIPHIEDDVEDEAMAIKRPSTPVPWEAASSNNNPSAEAVIKSSECCDTEADIWSEAVRTECWTKPAAINNIKNAWPQLDWPTYMPSSSTNGSEAVTVAASSASSASDQFNPNICVPTATSENTCHQSSANKENIVTYHHPTADKCYSCGQSSLFQSELQSVVFNSLIASLET